MITQGSDGYWEVYWNDVYFTHASTPRGRRSMLEATTEARQVMAHVRPGKTAKRNRQLRAQDRLQGQLQRHESRSLRDRSYRLLTDGTYGENVSARIKSEIAAIEARI